ncbi:MAG: rRNA pseudouridine synthase [Verrucomicrobia bacterium]|nr:rRNA pseudouridine synthase [Verrucomicrobiota bacterium]
MRNRLAKVLAAAGVASRRRCEEIILAGRVKVNGEIIRVPQHFSSPEADTILVDGEPIKAIEEKVYFIFNKPTGVLCSNTAPQRGKRVIDFFDSCHTRLFTVGRLDQDTSGLLLVTNDGHLANQIIHPSAGINKEYLAKVDAEITQEQLERIAKGCIVEETFVRPLRVLKVRNHSLKVTIGEGKKREVRALLAAASLPVLSLQRIRIGNLHLGNLPLGGWRKVSREYLLKAIH